MHNDYVQIGGLWPLTHAPTPDQLRKFDQLASEALNGDGGGAWSPTTPIIVGGAGVQSNARGGFSGPITTGRNAKPGGALILGDSDYPTFPVAKTVTRLMTPRDFGARYDLARPEVTSPIVPGAWPIDESVPGALASLDYFIAGGFSGTPVGGPTKLLFPIPSPLLVIGSMFTEFRFRMRVRSKPGFGGVSLTMPRFRVIRVSLSGTYLGVADELCVLPNWTAGALRLVGDVVIPTVPNGFQFRCTSAGTSGGSQPAGFAGPTVGVLVTDGGAIWKTEIGPTTANGHFCSLPFPSLPSSFFDTDGFYNGGQAQDIVLNAQTGLFTPSAAVGSQYTYMIEFQDPTAAPVAATPPRNVYHSLSVTMGGITSLRNTF